MIHINRDEIDIPAALIGDSSKGQVERDDAIRFYEVVENKQKTFEFKAYKDDSVKKALNMLTHGKCAYCESKYEATQPVDIEHFRPKGAVVVDQKLRKPGYYWLAASWGNLLPSCIDCNRPRTQDFPDIEPELAGKANLFPLAGEIKPAEIPGEEIVEEPHRLLLDPCLDHPEEHLEFMPEGLIRPVMLANGTVSEMGEISIDVYGLRRVGLVKARKAEWLKIQAQMKTVLRVLKLLDDDPEDEDNLVWLADEMSELRSYMLPEREYSGMAAQVIKKFLEELGIG